jgi:hypothetical protein
MTEAATPAPVTPATDANAVKPRRPVNRPSYKPRATHSTTATPPISAVRRHPPTRLAKAGPSETNGRKPTLGPAMTSATATTAIAAIGNQ